MRPMIVCYIFSYILNICLSVIFLIVKQSKIISFVLADCLHKDQIPHNPDSDSRYFWSSNSHVKFEAAVDGV